MRAEREAAATSCNFFRVQLFLDRLISRGIVHDISQQGILENVDLALVLNSTNFGRDCRQSELLSSESELIASGRDESPTIANLSSAVPSSRELYCAQTPGELRAS